MEKRLLKTHASLFKYGIWYVKRFLASDHKTLQALRKKAENPEIADAVAKELSELTGETTFAHLHAELLLERGKSAQTIRMNLRGRGFRADTIESCLVGISAESGDFETYRQRIGQKIEKMRCAGKSGRLIEQELSKHYGEFRTQIREMLDTEDNSEALEKWIGKYRSELLSEDRKTSAKAYEKILRRGFSYDEIRKTLRAE